MKMKLENFNPSDYPDPNKFEPIPAADYLCVITDSEEKRTRAGTGSYLALTFEVIEGKYKGRKVWANLNIRNPNKTAEQIGREHLAAICRAVGATNPGDSYELHNKPLVVSVDIEKRQDTGKLKNVTTTYRSEIAARKSPDEPVALPNEIPF
jgi:hypothetical protein